MIQKNSGILRDAVATAFPGSELLPYEILELKTPYKLFVFSLSEQFLIETAKQTYMYSVK